MNLRSGRHVVNGFCGSASVSRISPRRPDCVPSGEYRLWADAVVQGERWTWLERVRVRGGDALRVSLSNANADDDPFRCQHWLAREDRK